MKTLILGALLLFSPGLAAGGGAAAAAAKHEKTAALRFTKHAETRMQERGVDHDTVRGLVDSVTPFKYWHQGKWKTGYYDASRELFVATDGGVVITVITGATARYVEGLKRRKP